MLIPRQELHYDFQGAEFDLSRESDRKLLAWVFNQFLYGEVTGIQCGHWLYRAPHLNAASFLAKQAGEELSHVRKILRILTLLGEKPGPAHWSIKLMSTGMMGGSWGEHVTLEMALGEGLVLSVFYAMAETIPNPEIRKILESAIVEEERHVEFGERETLIWLENHPESRSLLLGQSLIQLWAMQRLRSFVTRKVLSSLGQPDHPVLRHFGGFYDQALRCFELRIERLGLSRKPLRELGMIEKTALLAAIPWGRLRAKLSGRTRLLTSTYLDDPQILAEDARGRPQPAVGSEGAFARSEKTQSRPS